MTDLVRKNITHLLEHSNVMSIACSDEGSPWSASVFFVSDGLSKLYFFSSGESRHSRVFKNNPEASATVIGSFESVFEISGLQIQGEVCEVPQENRSQVLSMYFEKFDYLREVCNSTADEEKRIVAQRIKDTPFYCLKCKRIRLIDNSQGFGFKKEVSTGF